MITHCNSAACYMRSRVQHMPLVRFLIHLWELIKLVMNIEVVNELELIGWCGTVD